MNQFYPDKEDISADDEITLKIYDYFEKSGFDHSPSNLGG
jgi:hypothetical protein